MKLLTKDEVIKWYNENCKDNAIYIIKFVSGNNPSCYLGFKDGLDASPQIRVSKSVLSWFAYDDDESMFINVCHYKITALI